MNLFNYDTYEFEIELTHKRLKQLSIPNCENATQEKTLFDFIIKIIEKYYSYKNQNENCVLCAICDYMNIIYNEEQAKYKPIRRTNENDKLYKKVACFSWKYANNSLKENNIYNLKDLIKTNLNCIITVACNGGYHAIAYINGLFYNNWNNRKGMTLEELKNDFNYTRMPKLICIETNNTIIDNLEKAIKLGLIVE